MKKLIIFVFLLGVFGARADSSVASVTVTNAQAIAYADFSPPISGYLERIEVAQDSAATSTVTVASYADNGTTAIDTFATLALTSATKVFRPRFIGTDNAGTALAAANSGTPSNAVPTAVLYAPYERQLLGGNVRAAVTGTANDGSNPVKITVYYEPIKH